MVKQQNRPRLLSFSALLVCILPHCQLRDWCGNLWKASGHVVCRLDQSMSFHIFDSTFYFLHSACPHFTIAIHLIAQARYLSCVLEHYSQMMLEQHWLVNYSRSWPHADWRRTFWYLVWTSPWPAFYCVLSVTDLLQPTRVNRSYKAAVLLSLVTALVLSRIDYGNATLAGLPTRQLCRLQSTLHVALSLLGLFSVPGSLIAWRQYSKNLTGFGFQSLSSWRPSSSGVLTAQHQCT